jgi:hypothetical protein
MGGVAGLRLPIEQQHVLGAARDDVQVEMPDRLAGALAIRLHQIDALGFDRGVDRARHPGRGARGRGEGLGRDVEHRRVMRLRDHQAMPVMHRVDVHEGQCLGVLEQLEARDRAGDDLAEDASGIRDHAALHAMIFGGPWHTAPMIRY